MKRNRPAVIILVLLLVAVLALGVFALLSNGAGETVAAPNRVGTSVGTTESPNSTDSTSETSDSSAAPAATYTPEFVEGRCRFDTPMNTTPRCGWLTVPENRAVADGREVRIHVAVFESPTAGPDASPIIYLDGGPGGETLDTLIFSFDSVWSPLLEHGDLIFFDQRGVGYAEPSLACPEELELSYELLEQDLEPEEYVRLELEALGECRDRLAAEGIDLAAYNSASNAADVADLRTVLGYDEWNLLGISYGTRLAQTVMRDHPEGVRAVILDSTYPIEANLATEAPRNMDRAFDHFFAECAGDADCSATYPGLRERVFALVERLDAVPITVSVREFITGSQYTTLLTGPGLLRTMFQALYSDPFFPQLPEMIAELEQDKTSIASLLMSNNLSQTSFFSYGMHLSVQCHEEVAFTTGGEIEAGLDGYPEYEAVFATSVNISSTMIDVCALWGAGEATAVENEVIASPIPSLVLAGSYDPITPPRWGRNVAANLENAFFVEFSTLGHGTSIADECPTAIALEFLARPSSAPDTSCVAAMDPVMFIEEPFDPSGIVLELFEQDFFGLTLSGVFPAGWEQVQSGAWARAATGLDQTAIVQQAVEAPGLDESFILGLFADQFGIDDQFRFDREVDTEDGPWRVSTGTFETFVVDVAIRQDGAILGAVVLVSDEDERDVLVDVVLEPVLRAFTVS